MKKIILFLFGVVLSLPAFAQVKSDLPEGWEEPKQVPPGFIRIEEVKKKKVKASQEASPVQVEKKNEVMPAKQMPVKVPESSSLPAAKKESIGSPIITVPSIDETERPLTVPNAHADKKDEQKNELEPVTKPLSLPAGSSVQPITPKSDLPEGWEGPVEVPVQDTPASPAVAPASEASHSDLPVAAQKKKKQKAEKEDKSASEKSEEPTIKKAPRRWESF